MDTLKGVAEMLAKEEGTETNAGALQASRSEYSSIRAAATAHTARLSLFTLSM